MKITTLLRQSLLSVFIFTLLCGVIYTFFVTAAAQLLFPYQANGSMLTTSRGTFCSLYGQPTAGNSYLWGRPANLQLLAGTDKQLRLYAKPNEKNPADSDYRQLLVMRAAQVSAANPSHSTLPAELITGSASGLDPDISPAAAAYQAERIAAARHCRTATVQNIIDTCTSAGLQRLSGEDTVNVLRVNLLLDELLPAQ